MIATSLGVPYLGHSAMHLWKVGKQEYSVFSTHGSSGARLSYSKIKSALDLQRLTDAQLILMGHVHSLDNTSSIYYSVENGKVVEKERHVVLTGSFLGYVGSYAEQKNLPPAKLGTAVIYLLSKENKVYVSL